MAQYRLVSTLAAAAALLLPAAAHADTFTPNRPDDPAPNGCAIDDCSLREAVIAANDNPGPDTIVLAANSYTLSLGNDRDAGDPEKGDLDAEPSQLSEGGDSLTIRGAGADSTTIDAGGIDRVLESHGVPVTISGVTVTGGDAQGNDGGGIATGSPLVMTDAAVNDNTTGNNGETMVGEGGGIFDATPDSLSLDNVTVSGNTAGQCGGLSTTVVDGVVSEIKNSAVSGNRSTLGGGICANAGGSGGGRVDVVNTKVSDNHTCSDPTDTTCASAGGDGGGIYADSLGVLTVTKSAVTGNSASNGGGISHATGELRLTDSTLGGNTADSSGGGFYQTAGGYAEIDGTTISGNTARDGGGGGGNISGTYFCDGFCSDPVRSTITNSTIVGNDGTFGGGIADSGSDDIRLTNTTLNGNTSSDGATDLEACADFCGSIEVVNTIVGSDGNDNCDNVTSLANNIDRGDSCGFSASGDRSDLDPGLGTLGDNGGPTQTEALADASPAIDAAADNRCPTADQRGVTRPQGAHCDIGAFEAVAKQQPAGNPQQGPPQQGPPQVIVITRSEGGDKTPPKLQWSAPSPISASRFANGFNVSALCNEPCSLSFILYGSTSTAKLRLAGYNHVLARAKAGLGSGKRRVAIKPCVRGSSSSRRTKLCQANLAKRAAAAGNPFRVKLVVVATDAAGNRTYDKQFIRVQP